MNDLIPSELVEVSDVGVRFLRTPTRQEWDDLIVTLLRLRKALPFWIGDAILYGEHRWGDTYTQAIDATGRTYDTLASYVRVCKAVPLEMRRPGLPFEYHKRVALHSLTLDQRVWYLDRAESNEFENSNAMTATIKKEQHLGTQPAYEYVICPICNERQWKLKTLHAATCGHCQAHGEELLDRLTTIQGEYDELLQDYQTLERRLLNG